MWRIWLMFDPRKALVALSVFLFTLAILIHFITFCYFTTKLVLVLQVLPRHTATLPRPRHT